MNQVASQVAGFIVLAVAFALLNGVLFVGQEAWYRYTNNAVENYEKEMNGRWARFKETKATIDQLGSRWQPTLSRIQALKAEIIGIEGKYDKTGAPPDVYRRYKRLISEHNGLLSQIRTIASQHDSLVSEFNSQVDAYNADVQRFNALIERVPTSRWYIIPLPGRASSRAPTKSPARTLKPALVRP